MSDSSDKVLHKVHQHIQGQLEYTNSLVPALWYTLLFYHIEP